jgi:hypothetical protein
MSVINCPELCSHYFKFYLTDWKFISRNCDKNHVMPMLWSHFQVFQVIFLEHLLVCVLFILCQVNRFCVTVSNNNKFRAVFASSAAFILPSIAKREL